MDFKKSKLYNTHTSKKKTNKIYVATVFKKLDIRQFRQKSLDRVFKPQHGRGTYVELVAQ